MSGRCRAEIAFSPHPYLLLLPILPMQLAELPNVLEKMQQRLCISSTRFTIPTAPLTSTPFLYLTALPFHSRSEHRKIQPPHLHTFYYRGCITTFALQEAEVYRRLSKATASPFHPCTFDVSLPQVHRSETWLCIFSTPFHSAGNRGLSKSTVALGRTGGVRFSTPFHSAGNRGCPLRE